MWPQSAWWTVTSSLRSLAHASRKAGRTNGGWTWSATTTWVGTPGGGSTAGLAISLHDAAAPGDEVFGELGLHELVGNGGPALRTFRGAGGVGIRVVPVVETVGGHVEREFGVEALRGVEQHQPLHRIRAAVGQVQRQRATERVTHDDHRMLIGGDVFVDHRGQRPHLVLDAPRRSPRGPAVTDQIRRDEAHAGEVIGQRCPAAAVPGESVDRENRRTAAEDMRVESCHPSILPYAARRTLTQVAGTQVAGTADVVVGGP